ncbi:MAG: cation-translocating P-type ATPase [Candidatus Dormibacteria bacterium]
MSTLAQLASVDVGAALKTLESSPDGLSTAEATSRLARYGRNEVTSESRSFWSIAAAQARSGINILLGAAGVLTIVTGDLVDGAIILGLIALNVGLSIFQEYRAELALEALRSMLPLKARARRDGTVTEVAASDLVPGDVVNLRSGDLVPADLRLIEAQELEVNQATLTGESVPQTKSVTPVPGERPVDWTDVAFAGTDVVGGEGVGVVAATGSTTQFGETASLVKGQRSPGDFEVNLTHFGAFLLRFGVVLAAVVFLSNALLGRGILVSLTLALAVALGVVPEALPAVTATTLALGAAHLARKNVLVRRLAAVEDLSAVDTLAIDKTGTITENRSALTDVWGDVPRTQVLELALLASSFPDRGANVIDDAVIDAGGDVDRQALLNHPRTVLVRFSSETKRVTVAVERDGRRQAVSKGAAAIVLEHCTQVMTPAGAEPIATRLQQVNDNIKRLQAAGDRVLAVAVADLAPGADREPAALTLVGLLGLSDPPRPHAEAALREAAALGLSVKIVTGDAMARAQALCAQIHLDIPASAVVSASELSGPGITHVAQEGRIFGEAVPADKYHLVRALQALGHHVLATGDGVNDAPALQTADVGVAMASGTAATKGASDLVLLKDDIATIIDAVKEGRRTFTNINRYLLYTMVSNFANVVIVAVASLFLSYLPMLPAQVLLLNVLADLPMLAIVTDNVGHTDLATPRAWNIRHLVELSVFLGIVNAVFTFGLLRFIRNQDPVVVHTAWFLFLGSTALLVLFAVRTDRWLWTPPLPSRAILLAVGGAFAATVALADIPLPQRLLGFAGLPWQQQLLIELYAVLYVLVANGLRIAYDRYSLHTSPGPRRPAG